MTSSDVTNQLDEKFPKEALKQVRKGGDNLDYIPIQEVVARLNRVLGVAGWRVVESDAWRDAIDQDWIVAKVTLEAEVDGKTTRRVGWGGQKIKNMKDGGPVDLGDEFKGATSDALKKAATHLGVGLYLSRDESLLVMEEDAREPKATPDMIKYVETWVDTLDDDARADFVQWWKDNVGRKLNGGRVTVEHMKALAQYDEGLKIPGV